MDAKWFTAHSSLAVQEFRGRPSPGSDCERAGIRPSPHGSWQFGLMERREQSRPWHVRVARNSVKITGPSLLPLPAGYRGSVATSINQSGWIVGNLTLGSSATRAFLCKPGGIAVPLAALLPSGNPWVIVRASSINSVGQIAATGYRSGLGSVSRPRGLLLTPSL